MAARGEIIDRIAASVGNRVVTTSALDRQIRVTAFQDGVKLDFSPAHRRTMLESMIEQNLVQLELASSRYPLPDPAELVPAIDEFKKAHFKDEAAYQAALAAYGITEEDFKELLLWQRTLLLFIQVRFETGVQVSAAEVEQYFAKTVKPAGRSCASWTTSVARRLSRSDRAQAHRTARRPADGYLAARCAQADGCRGAPGGVAVVYGAQEADDSAVGGGSAGTPGPARASRSSPFCKARGFSNRCAGASFPPWKPPPADAWKQARSTSTGSTCVPNCGTS